MTPNLFIRVAEVIETLVKDENARREAYESLIESFEMEGFDEEDFSKAMDIDPILDAVLEDWLDERNLLDEGFDDLDD